MTIIMEVDENNDETFSRVSNLLSSDISTCDNFIKSNKKLLPEIINHAGHLVTETSPSNVALRNTFLIVCSKLMLYNKYLKQHIEPWLCKIGSPWNWCQEPSSKKQRVDPCVDTLVLGACYQLLLHCDRLRTSWDWVEIFQYLTSSDRETKFLVTEILRVLFDLTESAVSELRNKFLSGVSCYDLTLKFKIEKWKEAVVLAEDCQQSDVTCTPSRVASINHVSLPKCATVNTSDSGLVEVPSTTHNLQSVGAAVCVGQPVLIVGDVGVGKTSLVLEWGARCGHEVVTLQVSDSTDARLLVGLYRCTEIPGQFVWEPGLLTRAVLNGQWLLIEDIDRASQDVISLLSPLVQDGQLNVPSLGGQIQPAPGFQLFLTQRDTGVSGVREELAKLVRAVPVTSLSQDELKQIISTRFPVLEDLTEKILRLFTIIRDPANHIEYHDLGKLRYVLGNSRCVSTRDLIRWCDRAASVIDNSSDIQTAAELLYQDAMDIFSRFISDISVRNVVAEEIAFTLNISKERATYYTSSHKPNVSLKKSGLQVGRVLVPISASGDNFSPPQSVFSVTRHAAVLLESVARAVTCQEPVLLVGETGVGKTTSVQFLAEKTGRKLRVVNMNQQSDSADLLGGFKPVSLQRSLHRLREMFVQLFCETFSTNNNAKFLGHLDTCFTDHRWNDAIQLMNHTLKAAMNKVRNDKLLYPRWKEIKSKIKISIDLVKRTDLATVFAFIEGILTEAIKDGDWILLDEVNMAPASVLECLSQLLDKNGSVTLYEAGEHKSITRHPDFRLFACMNPATDTGKCDLPPGLRNRFTEVYCDEMNCKEDIMMLVTDYLTNLALPAAKISSIVTFYMQVH